MYDEGTNQELLEISVVGLTIYAISFLFKGINTFASAFFTALNNGLVSGILAVCRALVFSIGAVLILIRQLSKKGSCRFLNFVIQL